MTREMLPWSYDLMSRSKWPLSASDDVGVYDRVSVLPDDGMSAWIWMCWPIGRPSVSVARGSA